VHAAHVFGRERGQIAELVEARQQAAAQPFRVVAGLRAALLHTLPKLPGKGDSALVPRQRVVAEVEAVGQRVQAVVAGEAAGVDVVAEASSGSVALRAAIACRSCASRAASSGLYAYSMAQ